MAPSPSRWVSCEQGLTRKPTTPEAVSPTETRPRKHTTAPDGDKTRPSSSRSAPSTPPQLRPLGIQAETEQSHPKRCLAFYSHRAASSLVPKLPPFPSGTRARGRAGALSTGCRRVAGRGRGGGAGERPASPPRPRVLQVGRPSGPRPLEGAPGPLLPTGWLPPGGPLAAREVDLLVHARMVGGGQEREAARSL